MIAAGVGDVFAVHAEFLVSCDFNGGMVGQAGVWGAVVFGPFADGAVVVRKPRLSPKRLKKQVSK